MKNPRGKHWGLLDRQISILWEKIRCFPRKKSGKLGKKPIFLGPKSDLFRKHLIFPIFSPKMLGKT
jgi:hypothetical protein